MKTVLTLCLVLLFSSCASKRSQVAVKAPTSAVPFPQPLPADSLSGPPRQVGSIGPDPVTLLLNNVEAVYGQGIQAYRSGNLEEAKQKFDQALRLLLESKFNIQGNRRLDDEFQKLVEKTYGLEVATLESGDTLSQHEYEPAPIESFAGLTFPVDPKVRERLQRELLSVRSDLPLVSNDYVAGFLTYFQNRGQGFIDKILQRVGIYRPMISKVLGRERLPQDLIYLAGAESEFNPFAVSRAGARGIWQFMAPRGEQYGLKINRWVDEREDPLKSTEAAAHHLKDLYQEFGDWYLAIAAYNCGPLNVQRAIEKTGYANFWKLRELHALPEETQNYVPIIIATALIAKDPTAYGFDVQAEPPLDPDQVVVTAPTDLRLVAQLIDRPVKDLLQLNPSLLRWCTPLETDHFVLNLPVGTKEKYEQGIAAIPASRRIWWRVHDIENGETLASVARKYHLSKESLMRVNHLEADADLKDGERLVLPIPPGRESLIRNGAHAFAYRIRRGDNLSLIARRFHVSVTALRRWNHLKGSKIIAGRTLRLFGGRRITRYEVRGAGRHGRPTTSGYLVKHGDTLSSIARRFHVSVADLQHWNHIRGSRIVAGTMLAISRGGIARRESDTSTVKGQTASPYHYQIRQGDTLGVIAGRFDVTVSQIRRWNHLSGSLIVPGQTLTLYGVSDD